MKIFRAVLFFVLAVSTVHAQSPALDPAKLVGRWSGSGSFFKADVQRKAGPLHFAMEFDDARAGSGRVGGATMQSVRVNSSRNHLEIDAALNGAIGPDPMVAKHQMVLLVTQLSDSTITAEFHLKSNSLFDPSMREGRVVLTRTR